MKIGIMGPSASIQMILNNTVHNSILAEMIPIPCNPDEAGDLATEWQEKLDGILFTGFLPYTAACRKVYPRVPWEYMSRSTSSVLEALLNASYSIGCDISKVTYDLQENANEDFLTAILVDAGVPKERICVCCFKCRTQLIYRTDDYNEKVYAFHIENLKSGKAKVCLTGSESIQEKIVAAGYPAFWIQPTKESIAEQMNTLLLRCKMVQAQKEADNSRPTVIAISLQTSHTTGDIGQGEFIRHHISSTTADHLYTFAQRNGAAVEYHENSASYLYMLHTWASEESYDLWIQRLCKKLCNTDGVVALFIGVGSGATIGLAKACAERGRQLAELQKTTCYYILENNGANETLAGPFLYGKKEKAVLRSQTMDQLEKISKETGLGIGTVKIINDLLKEYDIDITTVRELANLSGMTNSYLNRVLSKLEDAGYVETIGRKPIYGRGRPQRLIRLKFDLTE